MCYVNKKKHMQMYLLYPDCNDIPLNTILNKSVKKYAKLIKLQNKKLNSILNKDNH